MIRGLNHSSTDLKLRLDLSAVEMTWDDQNTLVKFIHYYFEQIDRKMSFPNKRKLLTSRMLNGKNIFITGGTGTLGQAFIKKALTGYADIKSITIYSRDEMKQYELRQQYPTSEYPIFKWVIGDIRDAERLIAKMQHADLVIHAAAMKHIPICEENPEECIKTNIEGTKNVIHAAIANEVKQTILCSTDKAVEPISTYGSSKQTAEKLFLNAKSEHGTFSIVRLGNIWGSRGSVVPLFEKQKSSGVLTITDAEMTRFFCAEEQSAATLLFALDKMNGHEIFIPKMKAVKITDLAIQIAPACIHKIIGLRGFEKTHEKLVADIEIPRIIENNDYLTIVTKPLSNDEALDQYQCRNLVDITILDSQNSPVLKPYIA